MQPPSAFLRVAGLANGSAGGDNARARPGHLVMVGVHLLAVGYVPVALLFTVPAHALWWVWARQPERGVKNRPEPPQSGRLDVASARSRDAGRGLYLPWVESGDPTTGQAC